MGRREVPDKWHVGAEAYDPSLFCNARFQLHGKAGDYDDHHNYEHNLDNYDEYDNDQ